MAAVQPTSSRTTIAQLRASDNSTPTTTQLTDEEKANLENLKRFQTYKGANTSFGQRLFDVAPQYYTAYAAKGVRVQVPYFTGQVRELIPTETGFREVTTDYKLIDYREVGSLGTRKPIIEATKVKERYIPITSERQLQEIRGIAQNWQYAGDFSQDVAAAQKQTKRAQIDQYGASEQALRQKAKRQGITTAALKQQIIRQKRTEDLLAKQGRDVSRVTSLEFRQGKDITRSDAALISRNPQAFQQLQKRGSNQYTKISDVKNRKQLEELYLFNFRQNVEYEKEKELFGKQIKSALNTSGRLNIYSQDNSLSFESNFESLNPQTNKTKASEPLNRGFSPGLVAGAEELSTFTKSAGIGALKLVYAPNVGGGASYIDFGQNQLLGVRDKAVAKGGTLVYQKGNIVRDKDIQNLGKAAAGVALFAVAPFQVVAGFGTAYLYETAKSVKQGDYYSAGKNTFNLAATLTPVATKILTTPKISPIATVTETTRIKTPSKIIDTYQSDSVFIKKSLTSNPQEVTVRAIGSETLVSIDENKGIYTSYGKAGFEVRDADKISLAKSTNKGIIKSQDSESVSVRTIQTVYQDPGIRSTKNIVLSRQKNVLETEGLSTSQDIAEIIEPTTKNFLKSKEILASIQKETQRRSEITLQGEPAEISLFTSGGAAAPTKKILAEYYGRDNEIIALSQKKPTPIIQDVNDIKISTTKNTGQNILANTQQQKTIRSPSITTATITTTASEIIKNIDKAKKSSQYLEKANVLSQAAQLSRLDAANKLISKKANKTISLSDSALSKDFKFLSSQKVDSISQTDQIKKSSTAYKTTQSLRYGQQTKQDQRTAQQQIQSLSGRAQPRQSALLLNQIIGSNTRINTPGEPNPKIGKFGFFSSPDNKIYGSKKYKVEVRRKGLFEELPSSFGSIKAAVKAGLYTTQTTAAASFKITSRGKSLRDIGQLPSSFRQSKKEAGVFIQRRESRIRSIGEKREITYKGILFNRKKK